MCNEPLLFDNTAYEHASVAVLFCRETLLEHGFEKEAMKLEGIDVTCAPMARVALAVLGKIHAPSAREAVDVATYLCKQALGTASVRLAS